MNALVFKRSGHRERGKIDETETLSRLEEGNVEPVVVPKGRDSRMERGHRRDVPGSDGETKVHASARERRREREKTSFRAGGGGGKE